MLISICIPTVRATNLKTAIDSIRRQSYIHWELVVVGQGEDSSLERIVREAGQDDPRIRYLHVSPRGISRARNAGIRETVGEVVAFTDDDCEADPDWLKTIAACFDADPHLGLVGGNVIVPKNTGSRLSFCPGVTVKEALYDPSVPPRKVPSGWDWIGANFAVRRTVLLDMGPFDESLGAGQRFPAGEDTDYKLRLERNGVRMLSTPRSTIYHTYGRRFGLKAILAHTKGYTQGNGATAAKLTLLGLPEGKAWLLREQTMCLKGWFPSRPHRLPWCLMRWYLFRNAYRRCLAEYGIRGSNLRPKNSQDFSVVSFNEIGKQIDTVGVATEKPGGQEPSSVMVEPPLRTN